MKVLLRKVYYCDFCKKSNRSASAMSKHEKHCTLNPKRECRLCRMDKMLTPEDCPICHFSKLRISGELEKSGYDFKKALSEYWDAYNKEQNEREYQSLCY